MEPPLSMRRVALCALAASFLATSAAAQEPVEIRVTAAGMTVTGIEVHVLVDGEPWRVGETGPDGRLAAPANLVGLRPGDPGEVHQVVCADDRTLLHAPPGQEPDEECSRRRERNPTCGCGSLGAVAWDRDIAVDLVSEDSPLAARPPRDDAIAERPTGARAAGLAWTLAAGAGWSSWPNLEEGCGGALRPAGCRIEAEAPTYRVALEARPDFPLSLLAAAGYTSGLVVAQNFGADPNPREPRTNEAELSVLTLEGYAVARRPIAAVELFAALGYVWAYETVEATTTFGAAGLTANEERADSGGRLGGRAGLDWWSAHRSWGARLEVGGMTGDGDAIDAQWSAVGMVLVPLGGR